MAFPKSHDDDLPDAEEGDDGPPPLKDVKMLPFFLIRQNVSIDVNFREKRIDGTVAITVATIAKKNLEEIVLDARQCEVDLDNVEIELVKDNMPLGPPKPIQASYRDPYELLDYPTHYNWNATHHDLRSLRMRPLMHASRADKAAENREEEGSTPVDGSIRIPITHLIDRPKEVKEEPTSATSGIQKRPIKIRVSSSFSAADTAAAAAATPGLEQNDTPQFSNREYRVTIPFTTKNIRDGLQFVGVDPGNLKWPHVYTRHSIDPGNASCIFPCVDDHGQTGCWTLSIKFPRTLGDALRQPLVTQNGAVNGHQQNASDVDYGLSEEDKMLEMTALCSGFVVEEFIDPTNERKKIVSFDLEKKISVQKIGFAIGPFQSVDVSASFRTEAEDEKLGANALKIQAYCLPGRAEEALNTCQALPSAADFFTWNFARYPFDEYCVCFVDDLLEDAVAVHSLSFASTRLLYPENVVDPETEVAISRKLIHSLATQWSGINLVPSRRRDLWVVIGIAYFMTDMFLKKLCGNNDYRFRMKTMSDKLVEEDVRRRPSLYDLGPVIHIGDFEADFMALKAPLVLFILDKRLTKAPAQTNLLRIVSRLLYRANIRERQDDWVISTETFRRHCEKTSKSRLESFWKQWVYGSGCPRFKVTQKFNKKKLCVEMLVRQTQGEAKGEPEKLVKANFLQAITEKQYGVAGGDIQVWFAGPMTIRIHEADGTPYEHIVDVREDGAAARQCKFDIPYNTKYKRLKRSRRQRDRAAAQTAADGENAEESLLYCLGDVLQGQEDVQEWDLMDWSPAMERRMDQESYEWIRMDADFEWICTMTTNSESYMYVSQLQQDRDVVAQQDTMLFLGRTAAHPLVSSILTRTLFDRRYFHGIRTMAASQLHQHGVASEKDPMVGLFHLLRTFSTLYCFPGTTTPRPNDFSDRKSYIVQSAIPLAVARTRDEKGKCPERARRFLLEQIQFNNNSNNAFSDNFYVAKLLEALATSLIPSKRDGSEMTAQDKKLSEEEEEFLQEALIEIDRYRRMDEWANSYHNIWTTTALDCKQRLMKAGVIPRDGLDFVQYLQDETYDLVRIKAFEALVDLGFLMDEVVFAHLLRTLSTDNSPYVRHQLLKVFSSGLAALAIGEFSQPRKGKEQQQQQLQASKEEAGSSVLLNGDMDLDDQKEDDDMLVIEAGDQDVKDRQADFARKHDLEAAVAALKAEVKEQFPQHGLSIQKTIWKAVNHGSLGRREKFTLLNFCSIMFDPSDEWIITVPLPQRWKFSRPAQKTPGKLIVTFTPFYRGEPINKKPALPLPPPPAAPAQPATEPVPLKPAETKRLIVNPKGKQAKATPASHAASTTAAAPAAVAAAADSIVAQTPARATPAPSAPGSVGADTTSKSQKRPRADKAASEETMTATPAAKRPKLAGKTNSGSGEERSRSPARKIVTLRHPALKRLIRQYYGSGSGGSSSRASNGGAVAGPSRKASTPLTVRASPLSPSSNGAEGGNGSTILAKPARKPLPSGSGGGGDPVRKPLPTGVPPSVVPPSSSASSATAKPSPSPAPSAGSGSGSTKSNLGGGATGGVKLGSGSPPADSQNQGPKTKLKLVIKRPGS